MRGRKQNVDFFDCHGNCMLQTIFPFQYFFNNILAKFTNNIEYWQFLCQCHNKAIVNGMAVNVITYHDLVVALWTGVCIYSVFMTLLMNTNCPILSVKERIFKEI